MHKVSYLHPNGFVIHHVTPPWMHSGSYLSAWFGEDGTVKDAEVISVYNPSGRQVKRDSALWLYAERMGRKVVIENQTKQPNENDKKTDVGRTDPP